MERKKVMFIEPRGVKSNIFSMFMKIPLLGPVYLGTIARNEGYDVSIVNENIAGRSVSVKELASADILCMSCITSTADRGKQIAKRYKAIRKVLRLDSKAIIGGIHASTIPEDVAPHFDQVIIGEAENIILDVLSGKIKDKIVRAPVPENLDEIPFPDFSLIKNWKKMNIWPLMTSRGCPFDCNFCAVTRMFGRRYRTQSPKRVVDELLRYKRGKIFFSDDHFVANAERTNNILDLMKERGFNKRWSAQVRTEITKRPELVGKMRDAGCGRVYVGFESVNPKSLEEMNKHQTIKDIKRSIKVFHDNGMEVHGMFILGNDSDTKESFRLTPDFCKDNDLDYVQYSILTPLPGTRTYFGFEEQGRILHRKWQFYDGLHAVHKPKNMTPYELQQGMIDCFRDFYTYSRGVKEAVETAFGNAVTAVRKTYSKVHFQTPYPSIMKFIGRGIINKWISHNQKYLNYVKRVSGPA